jgi:hypothetical protein
MLSRIAVDGGKIDVETYYFKKPRKPPPKKTKKLVSAKDCCGEVFANFLP